MSHRLLALAALFLFAATAAADAPVAARQKLYVTNSLGDDVTVIDLATGKPMGRIEVGPHPHGIAAPADQSFLLVTIEGAKPGELVWIDPATDKVTKRMTVGPTPNQLAVTPDGKFAYVPVSDGHWDVVDVAKAKVIQRIRTGGRPHNTVCSVDGKRMFLAPMGDPHRVTVVDVATHEPVGEIPFSDQVRPIALSRDAKRLYAEVDGLIGIEVADVDSRRMIYRIPDELTAEQKKVPSRSHGVDVRPDQKEVWECDLSHQVVHVFDVTGAKPKQTATIPMGGDVYWLTFTPDGKTCYVSVLSKNEVAAVDTETKKITARFPVGKAPKRLIVVSVPEKGAK